MLSIKKPKMLLPSALHTQFNRLGNDLKLLIESSIEHEQLANEFYSDFCDLVSNFYIAIERKKLIYATRIVEQFYSKWIDSMIFPDTANTAINSAITAAFSSLMMLNLAIQLACVSHYSVCTAYGLTLMHIAVSIKITTAHWISMGNLSNGIFNCKIIKTRSLPKKTHRMFRH